METWIEHPEASRSINAFSVEFVVRYMREAANLFDNDYDRAIIFLSILQANGRQNIREPFFRQEYADVRKSLPSELARPVSRLGLAESLGMSRETVRRKVAALIKDGYLEEVDDGVITARGVIGNEAFRSAQMRAISYMRQLLSDLRDFAGAPIGSQRPPL